MLVEKTTDVSKGIKGAAGSGFVINKPPGSGGNDMKMFLIKEVIRVAYAIPEAGSLADAAINFLNSAKDTAAPAGGSVIGKVNKKTGKRLVHGPGGTFEI